MWVHVDVAACHCLYVTVCGRECDEVAAKAVDDQSAAGCDAANYLFDEETQECKCVPTTFHHMSIQF